jgi:hypothetical protein
MKSLSRLNAVRLKGWRRAVILRIPQVMESPTRLQFRRDEEGEGIVRIEAVKMTSNIDRRIFIIPSGRKDEGKIDSMKIGHIENLMIHPLDNERT